MSRRTLHIGEVARRVGLSLTTIRHWDEVGIAPPTARSAGGFRLYTDDDVARLAFIKRFRPLGFGIDEIRDVLAARDEIATAADASAATATLERYVELAVGRCEAIRSDLADAEAFIADLRSDLAAHSDARPAHPG